MIGDRIKQARLAERLSMDALVAKMGNFVTKQAISKYENGKSIPSPETLIKIADALGVKTNYFLKKPTVSLEFISYRKHGGLRNENKAESKEALSIWSTIAFGLNHFFLPNH